MPSVLGLGPHLGVQEGLSAHVDLFGGQGGLTQGLHVLAMETPKRN